MIFGSVCSGIEAASVAWEPLGWRACWFAEVDRAASEVLAFRSPQVPNLGDMTLLADKVRRREIPAPDVLVGGTPCQGFSVAGLRLSLADPRGRLTLAFVQLANAIDEVRAADGLEPVIIVWENVPGVLSLKDNAFGHFLAGLAGESGALVPPGRKWTNAGVVLGPQRAIAWRLHDAQYHGLAQRRRRVFLVAGAGEGFDPASILFEFEGVRRDSPPRRETGESATHATAPCLTSSGRGVDRTAYPRGQDPVVGVVVGHASGIAPTLEASFGRLQGCSGQDANHGHGHLVTVTQAYGGNNTSGPIDVATARNAHADPHGRLDFESETFVVHGTQNPITSEGVALPLARNSGQENVIAFDPRGSDVLVHGVERVGALDTKFPGPAVTCEVMPFDTTQITVVNLAVRRLMPVECERLQGFADDWTLVPTGKHRKPAADGPRYKQCGNSMAVTCMRWIGRRIAERHARLGHNGGPSMFDEVLG